MSLVSNMSIWIKYAHEDVSSFDVVYSNLTDNMKSYVKDEFEKISKSSNLPHSEIIILIMNKLPISNSL